MDCAYTIVVFIDAAGFPTTVEIGEIPNRDETIGDIVQEALDRVAERDPMLAALTASAYVLPADELVDGLAWHFTVSWFGGYVVHPGRVSQ